MTDIIEWIQVITAFIGVSFTTRATWLAYKDVKVVHTRLALYIIALRRLRQQVLLLLTQITLLFAGIILLYFPEGPTQSTIRGFSMAIVSTLLVSLSITDTWENYVWFWANTDRRKSYTRRVEDRE